MKKISVVTVLLLITFGSLSAQKMTKATKSFETKIKKTTKNSLFAGVAITVVKDNKVAYQNAFGQADVAKKTPYTNQTLQPIASVSKTFIGVALMKAVEQGLFTLETPINDILPFAVKNPNSPDKPITIRHLATHTSGILDVEKTYYQSHSFLSGENTKTVEAQRVINELGFGQNSSSLPLKDFLKAYLTVEERNLDTIGKGNTLYSKDNFYKSEAGVAYNYSNIAASLAAYLIEVKSGKSFADYCKDNIFTPLSMNNTSWFLTEKNRSKMATLYWLREKPLPFYTTSSYPDGSLITSNEDLSKFLVEMMKGFSGESTFLTKASFAELFKKQYAADALPLNMDKKEVNSGIFWVYFKNGRLGHTGGDLGVTTIMAFYPEKKTGFIFLSNSETDNLEDNVPIRTEQKSILEAIKEFETKN
jgi:CubicO group peptidase (beta-lactamase class C family)